MTGFTSATGCRAPEFGSLERILRAVLIAVVLVVALPATASADVLIHGIQERLVCGDPITAGIWAQPGTTGSRWVRMKAIDRDSGQVWWRRRARATTRRWRYWTLPSGMQGRCRRTTFVYTLPGGVKSRFHIRFRSEGV
jgi:hypothetical protein